MRRKIIFFTILVLAVILRFWQLGKVPPSPDWDEVAIGWNAYSLLKTGRDEYGARLPLTFRSFDDYKPPLYFYLTVPSVALFGLNVFAVRFPSAFFGSLTVLLVYYLVKELFSNSQFVIRNSLIVAFLLAISPWHLQFSRIGFEANVALTWQILGVLFFLKSIKKKRFYFLISALFFGLSLYTYHSARVFVPLLVIVLAIIFRKRLFKMKKTILLSALIALVFVLPLIKIMTSKEGQMRMKGVSAFANPISLLAEDSQRAKQDLERGLWWGRMIHNRRLRYFLRFSESYLAHFNLNWLFVNGEGDVPRHHVPDMGLLYFWELPLILIGIYQLFFLKEKIPKLIVFSWWLLSPLAASVSADVPHAIRTLCFLPTWQIFTSLGMISFYQWLKKNFKRRLFFVSCCLFLVVCFLLSVFYYLHQYFVHQSLEYSQYWQYGYQQLVQEVKKLEPQYDKIRVSIETEQPYMFFLFYQKYDPQEYLAQGGTGSGGFWEEHHFGKYDFIRFNWENEKKEDKVLWVVTDKELPDEVTVLKTIYYLNGQPAFHIFKK